ncbi:MAG: DHH family phosphoesterase, partial [Patescibacteria group bacterium]
MSILGKKWLIKNNDKQKSILEKILENRDFRNLNELRDFYDPFLFNDMERAVSRIDRAIKSREHITIFGDYDVDGISGTAILVHILRKLNANVDYMLPNRVTDGYGLSEKFINEFIEKKVGLIITVDCGISCSKEIAKAKENNIDTIITDHHTIPETFPDKAFAILHPKIPNSTYPFSELTGAGVALKLAHALIKKYLPEPEQNDYLNSLLDLAALGTIADLGPLRDENRLIVSKGLDSLANTKWSGLKRIKELANIKEGD